MMSVTRVAQVALFLSSAPLLWACGSEAEGAGEAVVRDSAGITIVENDPAAAVPRWRIDSEPVLQIGDVSDPSQGLYRVSGARRLPDGRIVIANAGTLELRFYGRDGSFLRATGGEGEGPGEFQTVSFLGVLGGDSLLAYDFRSRRASVFDLEGEFVRDFPIAVPEGGMGYSMVEGIAGPAGRELFVRDALFFRPEMRDGAVTRDTVPYRLVDADGGLVSALGRFPGAERWVRVSESSVSVRNLPFSGTSRFGAARTGFYQGSADTYDIGFHDLDGSLLRRIRLLTEPAPVTEADVEAYGSALLAGTGDERSAEFERLLRETPFPETKPAHGELGVDALGYLWVQEYRPSFGEAPDRWRIFDPEGRWVATAELPPETTVYEIGEDWILARWQDDFDVEYVRLYRLERERTP